MRKPRPHDFAPEYQEPSSPKPENVDLSDAVAIKPKPTNSSVTDNPHTERTKDHPEIRTENRSELRSVELPIKRLTKRYSFEFYEDQLTRLKQIKYNVEMQGKRISMSEIVREAVDEYFMHHHPQPVEKPNER